MDEPFSGTSKRTRVREYFRTHGWDAPRCGGSLQHLLPSPLHIAISLQRNLKRIRHGQPPCRGEKKRVKPRIVPAGATPRQQRATLILSDRRRNHRCVFTSQAGIAVLILIFCENSGQNNVQESARTAWFGIYRCIERMAIRPVSQTLGTRIANRAQTRRWLISQLL
jgi:hypothetical protein